MEVNMNIKKVDEKLYNKVKKVCVKPADDKAVMEKFGLSQATVRRIRNSKTWFEYQMKLIEYRESRKARTNKKDTKEAEPMIVNDNLGIAGEILAWVIALAAIVTIVILVIYFFGRISG